MNNLKFKVKSFDEATNSLVISFASDTTASDDPDQYAAYAFQPLSMWPNVTDIEQLKKCIATAGMHHARIQEAKEKLVIDTERVAALQALVGETFEYTVAELALPPAESTTPFQTV
jgi:predicted metal-dependent HD superfamily phosphohydrolase